jgi:hypothetical protein
MLAFGGVDDGGAGILAEGEHSHRGHFRIAEHGEGDLAVVLGGLFVFQDRGHLLQVGRTLEKGNIAEGLMRKIGQDIGSTFRIF